MEVSMNARLWLIAAAVVALCIFRLSEAGPPPAAPEPEMKTGELKISGPYVQDNLAVFLIHGADRLPGKDYLTLQEALEKKVVIVHETGEVNELSVENISKDQDVYIQSGDIVKGGRQDRTIMADFIVPHSSGRMPIAAFCVEHGRWTQRGDEPSAQFSTSNESLSGKELKLAAKQKMEQSEVWQQVAANQQKLARNTQASVAAAASPSSFQLTLESKAVQGHIEDYVKTLQPVVGGKDDVIGYAFAINGKINSADVYGSHALFARLWPKLLKSSAVEAVAELNAGQKFDPAKAEAVKACIDDANAGKVAAKDVTPRVQLVTKQTEKSVLFETRDRALADAPVHENYVNKK
jgi:hypothetical protein